MSDRARTCDTRYRGFFRSPRDRPHFRHIYDWQRPMSHEDDRVSPPRHRDQTTTRKNHRQVGTNRTYASPRTRRSPSPPRGCRSNEYRGRDRRRPEGLMDRASPLPYRRDYLPTQTQPVPNPRASRRQDPRLYDKSDPDSITYTDPNTFNCEVKRIPANPEFKSLVTIIHTFIKSLHHLSQMTRRTEGPAPRAISKMVDTLSSLFIPTAPTPSTRLLLEGAAIEWGHTVFSILKNHYEDAVEDCLEGLPDRIMHNWTEAFETAARWTHRGLPRISEATIAAAKAQIEAMTESQGDPSHSRPGRARTPATITRYRVTQGVPQTGVTGPVGPSVLPSERPPEDASGPPDPELRLIEASPEPSNSPSSPFYNSTSPVKGGPPSSSLSDSSDLGNPSEGEQPEHHRSVPGYTYLVTAPPFTTRKRFPDHNYSPLGTLPLHAPILSEG